MLLRRRTSGRSAPSSHTRLRGRRCAPGALVLVGLAIAFDAASAQGPESTQRNALRDVQLGETDDRLRVAFICRDLCPIEQGPDGGLRLIGVSADIELDLTTRSRHAAALSLAAEGASSRIALTVSPEFGAAAPRACEANGEPATCLDFTRAGGADVLTPPPRQASAESAATDAPAEESPGASPVVSASFAPPTGLREDADALAALQGVAPGTASQFRIEFAANGPAPLDPPPFLIRAPEAPTLSRDAAAPTPVDAPAEPPFPAAPAPAPEEGQLVRSQAFLLRDDGVPVAPADVGRPRIGVAVAPVRSAGERIGFSAPAAERLAPPALLGALDEGDPAETAEEADAAAAEEAAEETVEAPRPQSALEQAPDASDATLVEAPRAQELTEALGAGPPLPDGFDIRAEASAILGRPFDAAACEAAHERLMADAWALDALVDVGFCQAAQGAPGEADATFERLLDYTPDNYEALVGRALVAARRGSRGLASAYFQDALNALPPIDESNRIVDAMSRL